jgi:hypothetical protein
MKYLECSGGPFAAGQQYGEQAREEIRACLDFFRPRGDRAALPAILQTLSGQAPEILEEFRGTAEGAGVPLEELILMNHWPGGDECTPLFLKNSPDGVIVAKNNDASPDETQPFLIRKVTPKRGVPFLQLTYAGWLSGLDMMNAEGLANTHGSVGSCFRRPRGAPDIRLRMYQLMRQCRTADELAMGLQASRLTGKGFSIAVGDRTGAALMLDAAVPLVCERERNAGFAWSTNLYEAPGLENADQRPPRKRHICVYRQGFLRWMAETRPPRTLEDIKSLLSCHEPWAPCRHGGVHSSQTTWSMICLPQQGTMQIAHGPPCTHPYQEYQI